MDPVTHGAAPGAATAVAQTVVTHRGSSERAPERCGADLIYVGIEKAIAPPAKSVMVLAEGLAPG
eukprot:COSAG04_NODE_9853_length_827_cov_1.233516_1_plen_65_part_00